MPAPLPNWRLIQKNNFKNLDELCDFLEISLDKRKSLLKKHPFPLNIPQRLARKIKKNTITDPIFLQFVCSEQEMQNVEGFVCSPVSDESFQLTPRLLKKYEKRALLIVSSACAMHCRFCFRRNYPYEKTTTVYDEEIKAIKEDSSLFEIILSGGDPLSISDDNLTSLILKLDKIPHLKILRFHTRFPVGIPERITDNFLHLLKSIRLQTIFILHTNHKDELDADVIKALKKIQSLGVPILTHTVLLKGVNDNVESLYELFFSLASHGFIPYYLNQLDKIKGGHHFEVPIDQGKFLIKKLQEKLPGYAIPKYILEVPHEKHKVTL